MKINGRAIGEGKPPFIVAEAGINHNGDLDTAFQMIETAKRIGVDAIKFQTFKAREFNIDESAIYTYHSQGKQVSEPMLRMFERYEFSSEEWKAIENKCSETGILFFSTPQNRTDLELLLEIGIPAIKVGSDDFTNLPLLKAYAEKGLPLILSCGMADLGEVYAALAAVNAFERDDIALLLCTSEYPTPASDVNLAKLKTLRGAFPQLPLGFSDHTQGSLAAGMAVALGACIFEKHFTLDNGMPGPDHWFSENPSSMERWASSIREAWEIMGSPLVRPTEREQAMRPLMRRSIYVTEEVSKGEVLQEGKIGLFRPGDGLSPNDIWNVMGKKARRALPRGHKIGWDDLE